MLKGKKVAINAPETAASMVPKPKLNARIRVDGTPINSAAARLFATARMYFPGRVLYRKRYKPAVNSSVTRAAIRRVPRRVVDPTLKLPAAKSTLYGDVVKAAVPRPMMIMLTENVASSEDKWGALITRWTATV